MILVVIMIAVTLYDTVENIKESIVVLAGTLWQQRVEQVGSIFFMRCAIEGI